MHGRRYVRAISGLRWEAAVAAAIAARHSAEREREREVNIKYVCAWIDRGQHEQQQHARKIC